MNYIEFLLKKIFKSKVNIILLLILPIISISFLFINMNNQKNDSMLNQSKEVIKESSNDLSLIKDKKESNIFLKDDYFKKQLNSNIEKNIKNNNWNKAYKYKKSFNDYNLSGDGIPYNATQEFKRNNLLLGYLYKNKIKNPESENYPVHSLTFNIWINNFVIEIILVVIMIFILSNIYNKSYYEKMDKESLVPINNKIKFIYKILICSFVFYFYYIILNLYNLIFSYFINGKININYPYYVHVGNSIKYIPIINIYGRMFILQFLIIIFVVSFIYIISTIIKRKISTILFSLFFLIILSFSIHIFHFLTSIAKYIPSTYLDNIGIISGNSKDLINKVSFSSGVIVLLISIMVLWTFTLIKLKLQNREI